MSLTPKTASETRSATGGPKPRGVREGAAHHVDTAPTFLRTFARALPTAVIKAVFVGFQRPDHRRLGGGGLFGFVSVFEFPISLRIATAHTRGEKTVDPAP